MILMNRYKKNDTCLLDKCSLLDPRTKKMTHLDKLHQKQVHESIRSYLESCYKGSESQPVPTPSITKSKTSSALDDLLSEFSQPDNTTCSALSSASPVVEEFNGYPREPSISMTSCLLVWQKANEQKYRILIKYAVLHLIMQGTSVASERAFSTAGDIITKKRNRLLPGLVNTIMFLNQNYNLLAIEK